MYSIITIETNRNILLPRISEELQRGGGALIDIQYSIQKPPQQIGRF